MVKVCRICNAPKDEATEFYFRKDTGRYRFDCKACCIERDSLRLQDPSLREKNKARCRQRYVRTRTDVAIYNEQQRNLKIAYLNQVKASPCADCHRSYEPYVMDFDHVPGRGPKMVSISRMAQGTYTLESLKSEIAKCDLVCSNCHRRRTAARGWTREHAKKRATGWKPGQKAEV